MTITTPMATSIHPRRLVRSTVAAFVGFVSVAVLSLATDQVLQRPAPRTMNGPSDASRAV